MIDYMINPILMGGLVKDVFEDQVMVHLHGRLGVITVPKRLVRAGEEVLPGHEMKFYFSYIQVVSEAYDYDSTSMRTEQELMPSLLGGVITEVNDTAAKVKIMEHMGTIAVPRRWMFTDTALAPGQLVEFYLSPMQVTGKRDIPQECI